MSPVGDNKLDETNVWDGDRKAIAFGETLFSDTRLSTAEISCQTCHDPNKGFSDGEQLSQGVNQTVLHSPSLWEVAKQRWFFWNGRCDSLWCQAISPIESSDEMDSSRTELVFNLVENDDLRIAYEEIFAPLPDISNWPRVAKPTQNPEDPANIAWTTMSEEEQHQATQVLVNVAKSIAAFEATFSVKEAPIDQFVTLFLADEQTALDSLTASEQEGLRLFIGDGNCHLCHSGNLFSDMEFHNIGLAPREWLVNTDLARYDGITFLRTNPFNSASEWSDAPNGERARRIDRLSQTTEQLGQFKTPTLRNLTTSSPYMHGGHFETLDEVIGHYSTLTETPENGHVEEFLQPRNWNDQQISSLVDFLLLLSSKED